MRLAVMLAAVLVLSGCSATSLAGEYLTSPDSGYGFEFVGDTVYSLTGEEIHRGDYTVEDSTVRVCFAFTCAEFQLTGDCLVHEDGYHRYCK